MALACPICEASWPDGAPRCLCGYDFETRDPSTAIARLGREARTGNRLWWQGLILLVILPFTFNLAGSAVVMGLLAIQLVLSATWSVQGLVRSDVATKRLAAAKALKQLPAARVIERE